MTTRRGGFSITELLVLVLVTGILAGVAMPAYQQMVLRARAASVVGHIHVVRVAALGYFADHGSWPPDVNRGIVPPELVPYLPGDYSFVLEEGAVLDWDHWVLPDGTPQYPETGILVGISLATQDEALGRALVELVGTNTVGYSIAEHYTFFLVAAQ